MSNLVDYIYIHGAYDADEGFIKLNEEILRLEREESDDNSPTRRLFYLALPPSVYPLVSKQIRKHCMNQSTVSCFSHFSLSVALLKSTLYPGNRLMI